MNRPTLIWESRSPVVSDCYRNGRISATANGGNAYDAQAALRLSAAFDVEMSAASVKRPGETVLHYWSRLRKIRHAADIVIREPFPIVFGRFTPGVKYVGMIHHIDDVLSRRSVWHRWYFGRLKKRLTALDMVVTVSTFWADYLKRLGCRNVRVIYNSFDTSEYAVTEDELTAARIRFGLPTDRPVVYLGNATRQKGVYTAFAALKDCGYHLVMSGPQNKAADLPVQYLQLDRPDYVRLLHLSSVFVCMSELEEGWNRIAHESMLCGTPVIGNGRGGMQELLAGGGQTVVKDPALLPAAVKNVLEHRDRFSTEGRRFAGAFDLTYFQNAWTAAMHELFNGAPN